MLLIKRVFIALLASFILCAPLLADMQLFDIESRENAYLAGDSEVGIILLHRRAKHARFHVVEPLRVALNQGRGWHTLSLQMPNADVVFDQYGQFFPEAYHRIQSGIDYLRKVKGVKQVIIIGHGMGARMAAAFLDEYPNAAVDSLIMVGMRNGGEGILDPIPHLRRIHVPVLDIYSDRESRDLNSARERSQFASRTYVQVAIKGADYDYTQQSKLQELFAYVVVWVDTFAGARKAAEDQPEANSPAI